MRKNKFNRQNTLVKNLRCACGGESKRVKRKNYPFGMKSKSKIFVYYVCKTCAKRSILSKNYGERNARK